MSFPLTAVHVFSEIRSHGPEVEGRDLGTLCPQATATLTETSVHHKHEAAETFHPISNVQQQSLCKLSDLNLQTMIECSYSLSISDMDKLQFAPQWSHDFGEGSSTLATTLENWAFHSSIRKKVQ